MIESVYHQSSVSTYPNHLRMLFEESGIDPEVVSERGYWTATKRSELTMFSNYQQRVPSLVIPIFSPDNETVGHQLRPDKPRVQKGKEVKYETPMGARGLLDVHPRMRDASGDATVPLWITEGIKKADSLTSRGLCTVGLIGVWNWQKDGELLSDWEHVALNSREVYVVFDSDVMVKAEVELALERLVGALSARGAVVKVIYLPDAQDGSKQGVDDYLAAGGTVEDLYALARIFELSDYTEARLSRDERLRARIEAAWIIHESMPTKTEKECIRRAVYREHIAASARRGKILKDGPRYYLAAGEGADGANVSQPTFSRHTRALEAEGFLRVEESDDPAHAHHYILLTKKVGVGNHNGSKAHKEEKGFLGEGRENNVSLVGSDRRDSQHPHAYEEVPGLRCEGVLVSWRLDDLGRRVCEFDTHLRLGPKRREILVHLFLHGEVHKHALIAWFASEKMKWRDFRRDVLGPMIDQFAIIEIEDGRVRLLESWRNGVEQARVVGKEQEARDRQVVNYELKKVAFRNRDNTEADPVPHMRGVDGLRKPWPKHPTGCACRTCSERFEPRQGTHVDDCKCGRCYRLRLNGADGYAEDLQIINDTQTDQIRQNSAPAAEDRAARIASKHLEDGPEGRKHPGGPRAASDVRPEPPVDSWMDHGLDCDCDDCLIPVPRYARLWR